MAAWAVQAANAARMFGKESHADHVADELNRLLVAHRGGDWETDKGSSAPTKQERAGLRRAAWITATLITLVAIVRLRFGA